MPGGGSVDAEVVGFNGDKLYMMPTDDVFGLAPGARVLPIALAALVLGAALVRNITTPRAVPCNSAESSVPVAPAPMIAT